ncbi:MAG: nitroreductase family protein [Clostridia bacterium]|nr:nitroreductase family protein [Clostridia bacterium]
MNVKEAIEKRRTIRKFEQRAVDKGLLLDMVDCARLSAYGANLQPLKFGIIDDAKRCSELFENIKWAGYLPDGAPKDGEKPMAYIAVLGDTKIKASAQFECDAGAAVTSMMLYAVDMGLATCWLGAINRENIHGILGLGDDLKVVYLLAVGYPKQESEACDMVDGNVKYYEDENGKIHVPKRSMNEILV